VGCADPERIQYGRPDFERNLSPTQARLIGQGGNFNSAAARPIISG
jgi:hypothetical protein